MAQQTLTARQLQETLAAYKEHGTEHKAAAALGITRGTFQARLYRAKQWDAAGRPAGTTDTHPSEGIVGTLDGCEITKTTHEQVRTLDDLVRVCEIDTDEWEIERWVCNKWDMGYKDDVTQKAAALPLFQVKAWLRRISGKTLTLRKLREELIADIKAAVRPPAKIGAVKTVDRDWLFEFAPFDLHMGKLAWGEETVTDYDVHHAEALFNASLDFLTERAQRLTGNKIARVLCVFGNDVSHIDSKKGQTTAGTPMDVDTRYIKVYRRIVAIHRRAVDRLRQIAPVDVVIVPGNHDELTSFHLGEILAAIYEKDPRVSVDNSPRLRKYYEYGVNLFGFTHGDAEKVAELPLTMAREKPDAWARCSSREWHIGHLHKGEAWQVGRVARVERNRPGLVEQDLYSDKGVRIRRLASLSSHDAWHTKHAYMDRRMCEGFIFHKQAGFTADLAFNVDHFTGKGLTA